MIRRKNPVAISIGWGLMYLLWVTVAIYVGKIIMTLMQMRG